MQTPAAHLHRTFAALADPTRRGILEGLRAADASIGDLAERYEMPRTGAAKQVRVFEDAGLVTTRKVGRVLTVTIGLRHPSDRRSATRGRGGGPRDRSHRRSRIIAPWP